MRTPGTLNADMIYLRHSNTIVFSHLSRYRHMFTLLCRHMKAHADFRNSKLWGFALYFLHLCLLNVQHTPWHTVGVLYIWIHFCQMWNLFNYMRGVYIITLLRWFAENLVKVGVSLSCLQIYRPDILIAAKHNVPWLIKTMANISECVRKCAFSTFGVAVLEPISTVRGI